MKTQREALDVVKAALEDSDHIRSIDLIDVGPGQSLAELGVILGDGTEVIVSVELA